MEKTLPTFFLLFFDFLDFDSSSECLDFLVGSGLSDRFFVLFDLLFVDISGDLFSFAK